MVNTRIESANQNVNLLCAALIKHNQLLNSGLTPYEAECATFTTEVVQTLEASTERMQENFGLFMQYQVAQSQSINSASLAIILKNTLSISDHIEKKIPHKLALNRLGPVTQYANSISRLQSCSI